MKNPTPPRRLEGFLRTGYLVHDVSRLRRMLYDQRSRHLGITRSQWWVLFNLARHDSHPLNQNELAQMLEMGGASMGELIGRLEKSGFVKREADPGDRRSKRVLIAERGREVLEHMRLVARANNDNIMAGISPEEQEVLNGLLSRMKHNLTSSLQGATSSDDRNGPDDLKGLSGPFDEPQQGMESSTRPAAAKVSGRSIASNVVEITKP